MAQLGFLTSAALTVSNRRGHVQNQWASEGFEGYLTLVHFMRMTKLDRAANTSEGPGGFFAFTCNT